MNLKNKDGYFYLNKSILSDDHGNFKHKTVLVIGCGSIKRYHVLKSLKNLNFKKMICLCKEKTWAYDYFDDWILADHEKLTKIEDTLNKVIEYEKEYQSKFDAIFTYDDYSILVASYLANHFKLPSIPFELAKLIKDKFEFRKLCKKKGIFAPKFCLIKASEIGSLIETKNDILSSIWFQESKIKFPVVVKNSKGSGKDFIFKCNNAVEFMLSLEKSLGKNMDLLIEEFYEGIEIDIEILIQNNQVKFAAVSDNFPAQEPSFIERGGICPSIELSFNQNLEIRNLLIDWMNKLGFRDACLHFEARCKPELIGKDNYLMPIEINQRIGGAETWSMILSSYNVNLVHEAAKISLGINLDELNLSNKFSNPRWYSISHNFIIESKKTLKSLSIDEENLSSNLDILEVTFFKSTGSFFTKNESIGWIVTKCSKENPEKILDSLAKSLESIKINFESIE